MGRPPHEVRRSYASFRYQAQSWSCSRRGRSQGRVARPANSTHGSAFWSRTSVRPPERVVAFYNQRGTAEQWIREGKNAVNWTRLSCRSMKANAVRLQLHALAYNLANFFEDGRGGLGHAATPRFPSPLIKPDVRISRIRLSDWFHRAAHGGGRVRCVLPKQCAMADAPSNTDRRPSSPRGKASSEASGYAGVFQAHRQSPILGSVQSAPEVRALSSASITRPPRSYGPLRLPSDPPPVRRGGLPAPVETGLPR